MELHETPKRHIDAEREFPRASQPVRNAIRRGITRVHGLMVAMPDDFGILNAAGVRYPDELGSLIHQVLYVEPIRDSEIPGYIREVLRDWDLGQEDVA